VHTFAALAAFVILTGQSQTPRHVSISVPDGGVVQADVYGTGDRGVVLAHGGRFDKSSWEEQGRALAEAGFRALAIDFRAGVEVRAGRESEIDRIVLLAHMPIDAPDRMTGRKLFIIARDDLGSGDVPRLPAIRNQYEKAPGPKELLILDGSAHAQFIFATGQGERLMREILRFLSAP
jgi:pimeloyl-ACP methyl ester carboxylesterase